MMTPNRLQNLDLGTLRSFVTIAETGSMTRAAGKLFMTQSAISMQIKRLETSLGLSVFDRSAQGMKPTAEGEQLLQFASRMLAINDEVMGRLTSPDYEGLVRLGVPGDVVHPHVPRILKEFNRDFPRVQVKFSTAVTRSLREQFEQGLQDIVLTTEQEPGEGGRILNTRALIWSGAMHGGAWKNRPVPLGISKNCAFRPMATRVLDEAGLNWIDVVASEDHAAAEAMIAADLCIGVGMECVAGSGHEPIDHGGQLPELPEFSIIMYCDPTASGKLAQSLAEYLLRAYA